MRRVKASGRNAVVFWARNLMLTRKNQRDFIQRFQKQVELFHDAFSIDSCYVKQPWY